jgi:hypothetical protein
MEIDAVAVTQKHEEHLQKYRLENESLIDYPRKIMFISVRNCNVVEN